MSSRKTLIKNKKNKQQQNMFSTAEEDPKFDPIKAPKSGVLHGKQKDELREEVKVRDGSKNIQFNRSRTRELQPAELQPRQSEVNTILSYRSVDTSKSGTGRTTLGTDAGGVGAKSRGQSSIGTGVDSAGMNPSIRFQGSVDVAELRQMEKQANKSMSSAIPPTRSQPTRATAMSYFMGDHDSDDEDDSDGEGVEFGIEGKVGETFEKRDPSTRTTTRITITPDMQEDEIKKLKDEMRAQRKTERKEEKKKKKMMEKLSRADDLKEVKCDLCGKKFLGQEALETHRKHCMREANSFRANQEELSEWKAKKEFLETVKDPLTGLIKCAFCKQGFSEFRIQNHQLNCDTRPIHSDFRIGLMPEAELRALNLGNPDALRTKSVRPEKKSDSKDSAISREKSNAPETTGVTLAGGGLKPLNAPTGGSRNPSKDTEKDSYYTAMSPRSGGLSPTPPLSARSEANAFRPQAKQHTQGMTGMGIQSSPRPLGIGSPGNSLTLTDRYQDGQAPSMFNNKSYKTAVRTQNKNIDDGSGYHFDIPDGEQGEKEESLDEEEKKGVKKQKCELCGKKFAIDKMAKHREWCVKNNDANMAALKSERAKAKKTNETLDDFVGFQGFKKDGESPGKNSATGTTPGSTKSAEQKIQDALNMEDSEDLRQAKLKAEKEKEAASAAAKAKAAPPMSEEEKKAKQKEDRKKKFEKFDQEQAKAKAAPPPEPAGKKPAAADEDSDDDGIKL